MQNLPRFKNQCAFCFKTSRSKLFFCCNIPLCSNHLQIHSGHSFLYSVYFHEDKYIIESDIYSEEEKEEISKWISVSDFDDDVEKVVCAHENAIQAVNSNDDAKKNRDESKDIRYTKPKFCAKNCGEDSCNLAANLYICLSCGYIGCGRLQYGKEGNEHARMHYESTKHPRVAYIESIGLDGRNNTYCYECDSFVYNNNIREEIKKIGVDFSDVIQKVKSSMNTGAESQDNTEGTESQDNTKGTESHANTEGTEIHGDTVHNQDSSMVRNDPIDNFLGIRNAGNTCYVSSLMHLISLVSFDNLESHFYVCQSDPFKCFMCQFIKVIIALQNKHRGIQIEDNSASQPSFIDILDFIVCLETLNPSFNRFIQQDVSEFLMFLFLYLKENEILGIFPNFSSKFEIKMKNIFECKNCNYFSENLQDELELTISFTENVQNGIDEYFSTGIIECDKCKRNKMKSTQILYAPEFLIIMLKIFKYENENTAKIINENKSEK